MRITLDKMLAARDRRAAIQKEMLEAGGQGSCLVCLTLNMAGDVKRTPMSRMLFERGLEEFGKLGLRQQRYEETDGPTGSEAFWLLDEEGTAVKALLEGIEEDESIAAARLLDFDVLVRGHDGAPVKLSRETARKCLICERPAAECARSRRHGLEAILKKTDEILREFCSDSLSLDAHDALTDELETTPKPGLVDLSNNGSHDDMNAEMFRKSAAALIPYFKDAALMGMRGCGMSELRRRGIEADREMLAATGGINTHMGLVYSMGLMAAGMGRALAGGGSFIDNAAGLAKEDATADSGAERQASTGFPDARYCAERLMEYMKTMDANDAGVLALADSIARLEDTNLLRRGGRAGLEWARRRASEIAAMPAGERKDAMRAFDIEMRERNLSPGGSADMLALAYLMEKWTKIETEV